MYMYKRYVCVCVCEGGRVRGGGRVVLVSDVPGSHTHSLSMSNVRGVCVCVCEGGGWC